MQSFLQKAEPRCSPADKQIPLSACIKIIYKTLIIYIYIYVWRNPVPNWYVKIPPCLSVNILKTILLLRNIRKRILPLLRGRTSVIMKDPFQCTLRIIRGGRCVYIGYLGQSGQVYYRCFAGYILCVTKDAKHCKQNHFNEGST